MIHLRAAHACPQGRADARWREHACKETTDRLRDELEQTRPLLKWPVRAKMEQAA